VEKLTDLELFVLALVADGNGTPYDLYTKAGVSIGSSIPVFSRLEKRGLLKGTPGARRSRRFAITKTGIRELRTGWTMLRSDKPTDPDAILRQVYLAWAVGAKSDFSNAVQAGISALKHSAELRLADAAHLEPHVDSPAAVSFRWMKDRLEAARLQAQSTALEDLAKAVKLKKRRPRDSTT